MEVLSSSLDLRSFQALINGLVKKNFYGNDQFTTDYLREQLYPESEMEASEVVNEILSFEEVLKTAAFHNWEPVKLNEHVRQRNLSGDHSKVIATVWSKEFEKINKKLLKDSTWNSSIDHLSWRVDIKAISKLKPEIDEPVAFFEFATKSNAKDAKGTKVAKFEMNREQVGQIVKTLGEIGKKFDDGK